MKTFEFIKVIYVCIFIFNLVAIALILDYSNFTEEMLLANTTIIVGYYIKEAFENIASSFVRAKYLKKEK